ncbi:MAG: NYN domain-containing protein [Vicinamibacterales bacterium]
MNDERLKIAVFIDFDNIEIGVKTTLSTTFDVGAVLDAIKERGEVVTKVAYGDWKRAGDHSRLLTQQAIRMVQRNVTPGGDKNGADINLALDALEMALTHDHINAFVIVGGDSDFISLVEKLKQYDKKVLVVGGRAFTSVILQKNCHEFIAYENIVGAQSSSRRQQAERARPVAAAPSGAQQAPISDAIPLVRRALKVLSEREVSPQLGLFKSTLLQLDSTFSERDYGSSSFRDFAEKLAETGLVTLKQSGRSLLVELKDGGSGDEGTVETAVAAATEEPRAQAAEAVAAPAQQQKAPEAQAEPPAPSGQPHEAVKALQQMLEGAQQPPRWPMYIRNVKQFMRSADPSFDERRYGFTGILDLLRGAQRESVLRLERDRQGVIRVFPGAAIQRAAPGAAGVSEPVQSEAAEVPEAVDAPAGAVGTPGESSAASGQVSPQAAEAEAAWLRRATEDLPGAVAADAAGSGSADAQAAPEAAALARGAEEGQATNAESAFPEEEQPKPIAAKRGRSRTPGKTTASKTPASRARKSAAARKPRAVRTRAKD